MTDAESWCTRASEEFHLLLYHLCTYSIYTSVVIKKKEQDLWPNDPKGGKDLPFWDYRSQYIAEVSQGMSLKVPLVAVQPSITSLRGTHFTAKALQPASWKILLASWLVGWLISN